MELGRKWMKTRRSMRFCEAPFSLCGKSLSVSFRSIQDSQRWHRHCIVAMISRNRNVVSTTHNSYSRSHTTVAIIKASYNMIHDSQNDPKS